MSRPDANEVGDIKGGLGTIHLDDDAGDHQAVRLMSLRSDDGTRTDQESAWRPPRSPE